MDLRTAPDSGAVASTRSQALSPPRGNTISCPAQFPLDDWADDSLGAEDLMATHLELGLDTFGDITAGPDGQLLPHAQVIRDVIDEAILADTLGVDFFGVGEHHRADFAVSAPDVVLAAIAGRTSRMRLGSAGARLGPGHSGPRGPRVAPPPAAPNG